MKKVTIAVTLLLLFISTYSQSCLPDGIEFTSQAQIDSFQVNYPGCTEIEGDLRFYDNTITNLDGLSVITKVFGDVRITFNQNLLSISGLANLDSIGGGFLLQGSDDLINIYGLEGLVSIGGHLAITANHSLVSIAELENLMSIGGNLNISGNSALTSLSGIDNIDPNSIGILSFQYNSSLSTCEVQSVCEYLSNPNDTVLIQFNATGCNSIAEVVNACETISVNERVLDDLLLMYPNPAREALNISAEGYSIDEVTIYTLTGQLIMQSRPVDGMVDISSLQPGMYIVEVMIENTRIRQKLLVQR